MLRTLVSRRRFLAVTATAPTSGCLARSAGNDDEVDWPQFGGSASKRSARPDGTIEVTDGDPKWTRAIGGGIVTSIVAVDDLLLFGTENGIAAHSIETGERRWHEVLPGVPSGTPAVAGDLVVGTAVEKPTSEQPMGAIAAFEVASGTSAWSLTFDDGEFAYAPTVTGTEVVVRTSTQAIGIDHSTGSIEWKLNGLESYDDPTYPSLVDLSSATSGNAAYVPGPDEVRAYDPITEDVLWNRELSEIRSSPVLGDKRLYVSSVTDGIYALDVDTGEIVWHTDASGCWTASALTDDALFATANGNLVALDPVDGDTIWKFDLHGDAYSTPIVVGDTVVAGSIGRTAVGVAVDGGSLRGGGTERWAYRGAGTRRTPAVADGNVFAVDRDVLVALGQ